MTMRIAVLLGGWSNEREVSLVSGKAAATALRSLGHDVVEIDVARDAAALVAALTAARPDVVFNGLHGIGGEDGQIQGLLDMMGLAYTHSGRLASALAMDKALTKHIVAQDGIAVAESVLLDADAVARGAIPFDPPYVIKPNEEGSSVGITIVRAGDNRAPALLPQTSGKILVERFIPGRELTVGVMGGRGERARAMAVTEIIARNDFYDYDSKYADGGSRHVIPADLPPAITAEALRAAALVHERLGCAGVSRSDFRYDENAAVGKQLIFLEINTQPGLTPTSLVPEQAAFLGLDFPRLIGWMVENAACHA
jgi:D-alanine-D-alanine ligase